MFGWHFEKADLKIVEHLFLATSFFSRISQKYGSLLEIKSLTFQSIRFLRVLLTQTGMRFFVNG